MIPHLREDGAVELRLLARLGESPHYAGSIHDDATAQRFGYDGALVPGAFVFGYMSRLAVATWGEVWLRRGTMQAHSRRPVLDGDTLLITATPLRQENGGLRADMTVVDEAGRVVATGAATLPDAPRPLTAIGPVLPIADPPPVVAAGGLKPGDPFGSLSPTVSAAEHRRSLAEFGEEWPGYEADGIIHPGMVLRLAMRDCIASYRYPTTGIYVAAHVQFFGLAHAGDRVDTRGVVRAAYQRNGHEYYDSEQVVTAGGDKPVALVRRSAIYAVRQREQGGDHS